MKRATYRQIGGVISPRNPRLFVTTSKPVQQITPARAPEDLTWQDQALCAETDPEAFFPEKGGSTRDAKRVCRSCPVRAECLAYALDHDERFGIYGGMSERERRRLKREYGDDISAAVASAVQPAPTPDRAGCGKAA